MDKKDVARILEQIASLLELQGENPFRARAFQAAAQAVASYPVDLREAAESGTLGELKGIGPATLEIVSEVLKTGQSKFLLNLDNVDFVNSTGIGITRADWLISCS
ncbi:MAG: hypothetical protein IH877_04395 [Gemmatimonadetes bacterium]|nr:hypothetical protein [Gemmatimonadota bacterium]